MLSVYEEVSAFGSCYKIRNAYMVGTYSPGKELVVYDINMQVLPTDPSPTTTHLMSRSVLAIPQSNPQLFLFRTQILCAIVYKSYGTCKEYTKNFDKMQTHCVEHFRIAITIYLNIMSLDNAFKQVLQLPYPGKPPKCVTINSYTRCLIS